VRLGVLAAILAGACLLGVDFSRSDGASFALGKTTAQEIRGRLGEPDSQATVQAGFPAKASNDARTVQLKRSHFPGRPYGFLAQGGSNRTLPWGIGLSNPDTFDRWIAGGFQVFSWHCTRSSSSTA